MKVLIAEEALQTGTGHWPGYIGGIAEGLRSAGDEVDIVVHKDCVPDLVKSLGGTPLFTRNCWLDPSSQGTAGGLRHNFGFRKELKSWIKSRQDPYDFVCALTMRLQHLLAFALLSRDRSIPRNTRFLLLFVQGFGHYAGPGKESVFPSSGSTALARLCFRIMAKAVRAGKVILAAETKGMQDELERFTGLPVTLFPHPVPAPPSHGEEIKSTNSITLACPGFARHEKGTDLLQDAILQLLDDDELQHAHFVLQWPKPFDMPDGTLLTPHETLVNHPRVEFRNENLNADEYERLLRRSDIILLPYRRESYHNRVSRVAIEGAGRGKPLVYMSETWTGEVADITHAGVSIGEESALSLAEAIRSSLLNFDSLKAKAESHAVDLVKYHSVERFRTIMKEAARS
jgi:glycosyltransferase involved in cell wall biosynthesis